MRTATARTRQIVEKSPYELAEIAARREGMDLDEWLEAVVSEEAAERGLAPGDLEPDERLDAIAKRLLGDERGGDERIEREERSAREGRLASDERPVRDRRNARTPEPAGDGLAKRFETAIEKLEARAQTSEARTAQAFETLTNWLERSEADRQRERDSLRTLNERLEKLDSRPAPAEPPRARGGRFAEPAFEDLSPERDDGRAPLREIPDAGARIARRQAELNARQAAAEIELRRKSVAENAERARTRSAPRDGRANHVEPAREAGADRASARIASQPQDDAGALAARLDRMRAKQGRRRPSSIDTDELRAGLAAMSRSVADLAPRNGALALQGAVGDLGERLSRARNAGADSRLVAPVEAMLRQVLDTLQSHDPRPVVESLDRELKAIGAKVESLASASVSPTILDAIRQQSREVGQMLAAAAKNPVPVARLEDQIRDLAERVDQLAHDPAPHAEVAQVMQMLAEAQAQIERSTPTSALRAIERRVEDLASRMDEAVRRPPVADPKPIEDLARRIDGVRASIDRQASIVQQAAAPANSNALEATLRDINAKLDRVAGGDVSSQAMIASLQDMTNRLEDAFRRPQSATMDPRPVQDLAQRIDGVRATLERQANVAPRVARLEAAIGGLSEKLERPAAPAAFDPRPLDDLARRIEAVRASVEQQGSVAPRVARIEAAIGGLSEKLERPAPQAAFDPRPLDDLARRIEGVRATVERQGSVAPRVARIEAAIDGISEKLERPVATTEPNGLNATLRELTERIEDAFRRPPAPATLDARPIEDLAKRIEGVRASVERQGSVAPQVARLEATLGAIAERLERPGPRIDTAALNAAIDELPARIEQAIRQHAPAVALDPAPIHELSRRIEGMRAIVERQANWGPQISRLESALADLAGKLERAAPGFDGTALVAPLEQLAAQIEEAFRRQPAGGFDPAPLDDLARRVDAVRASVERQTNWEPQFARLEGALGDLTAKLERAPPGLENSALLAPMEQLAAQIDEAFRRQPGGVEPAALENLAGRVEDVRAIVERQTNWGPQFSRLESALGDLGAKIERASSGLDASVLVAPLEQLAAQVEEAFRRPQASTFDPAPIQDLAQRVESVRASVERQANWAPQFARLESALGGLAAKIERGAPEFDAAALADSLERLGGQIEDAFRRPQPAADPAPFDDLARRIESVRTTVERQSANRLDVSGIEAALREVGAKLARPSFSAEDMGALVGAIEDLSARVDQGAARVDMAPFERMLNDLGDRIAARATAPAVDLSPIERRLDRLTEKVDAAASPSADMLQLELALRELSEKFDQAPTADTRGIETALRALRERIEERSDPQIDLSLVERAVDLIAKRLEQRIGSIDADALVNQIAEIHGRLDALGVVKSSSGELDRTLSDLMDELEAMRQQFDATATSRSAADLQDEQAKADRRMDARFASLQAMLERVGDRLNRIEEELTSEPEPRAPAAAPSFVSSPVAASASPRLGDIPDRAPERTPDRVRAELPRPGPVPEPAQATAPKHAAINAHIAAARRAANAALEESSRREEASGTRPRDPKNASPSMLQNAQSMVSHYRRPLLLGGAGLLAALTTVAVVSEFRGAKHPPLQKSEIAAPEETPVAELPTPPAQQDATSAALDPTPTGAIPSSPKAVEPPAPAAAPTAARAAGMAAPADLVATLPSGISGALRDSAVKGDIGSQVEVALRYVEGRGVPRDMKLAARWLELAANRGSPFAQYRLGALYEKGVGVTRDANIARGWYAKAANAGNARAMHNLAVLDAQDGGAGKPDYAEAANWFRRAASFGVRDSQFNLGVLYGRGLGVTLDLPQSWMWFSLAAQQGDTDAAHKRDEVANRMDGKALATATKALGEFKAQKPSPEANDAPPVAGAVDAKAPATPAGVKS